MAFPKRSANFGNERNLLHDVRASGEAHAVLLTPGGSKAKASRPAIDRSTADEIALAWKPGIWMLRRVPGVDVPYP